MPRENILFPRNVKDKHPPYRVPVGCNKVQIGHKLFSLCACGLIERGALSLPAHEFHRLVSNPRLVVAPFPVSASSDMNPTDETSGRGASRSLLEQTHDGSIRKRRTPSSRKQNLAG
jgi:hypothetical protein